MRTPSRRSSLRISTTSARSSEKTLSVISITSRARGGRSPQDRCHLATEALLEPHHGDVDVAISAPPPVSSSHDSPTEPLRAPAADLRISPVARRRDEFHRHHQATLGVVPAQERLDALQAAVGDRDDWLMRSRTPRSRRCARSVSRRTRSTVSAYIASWKTTCRHERRAWRRTWRSSAFGAGHRPGSRDALTGGCDGA